MRSVSLAAVSTALAAVAALSGCYAHVQLGPLPARDAPVEERVEAYEDLAPVAERRTIRITSPGLVTSNRSDFLILGNGLRVFYPEDLLPAVEAGSPTAQYIRNHQDARRGEERFAIWSAVAVGVGGGALAASIPFKSSTTEAQVLYYSAGAVLLAAMVTGGISVINHFIAEREKDSAFMSYDRALQDRLGLDHAGPEGERSARSRARPGEASLTYGAQ